MAEYIKPLFVEAQELVPADQLAYTKVYLKATAGMRLVTEEQGRVIYDTVYDYLSHASGGSSLGCRPLGGGCLLAGRAETQT